MPRSVLSASAVRTRWSEVLNRVLYAGERVLLVRHGRVIAALVPADEVELLDRLVNQRDIEIARRALGAGQPLTTRPWSELKRYWGMEE